MANFAIFNYQFDKIIEQEKQYELECMSDVKMSADEAFTKKQEIFGRFLQQDYAKRTIHFKNDHGPKEFIHRHLMKPVDNIVIMRIANRKTQKIVDENLKEKQVDDYQNCIVMIDNSEGIQRILIENRKQAFNDVKQVANIMTYTFNQLLRQYGLKIRLEHLKDDRVFWQFVKDKVSYPKGFHKVCFHLPYPNLERLKKTYDRLLNQARESFDSGIDLSFVASEGGQVRLDKKDSYQSETIGWLMNDAGADVTLYSNNAKKTPIYVGNNSYRTVTISDSVFKDVDKDDLSGNRALDEVKNKLNTGIDHKK